LFFRTRGRRPRADRLRPARWAARIPYRCGVGETHGGVRPPYATASR
jgi:hypothetical protein